MTDLKLGLIGGAGMLGTALLRAILTSRILPDHQIWVSSRSGQLQGFEAQTGLTVTADNAELVAACDVVLLCVPPAALADIKVALADKLVISVMAGVTVARITQTTGAERIIRAMSSPAAADALAYSPWVATDAVTAANRDFAQALFEACGKADEITSEAQLDVFTAMTGPVPGFVAFFAETMAQYAQSQGIAPEIADRAVRQLFLGAGQAMAQSDARPAEHVQGMIDYAGTTAAGLEVLRASEFGRVLAQGLDASVARCRTIG